MRRPSCEMQGHSACSLSKVSCLGSPPSTGTTQTLIVPLFVELNAICLPSGDNIGNATASSLFHRRTRGPRSSADCSLKELSPLELWNGVVKHSLLHATLSDLLTMYGIKERCVRITHRKDHHPQRLGAAAVVTRHFHVRRHHHRLTSFDRDWLAPLHF